ncbi:hypothetical protein LTR05_004282 [Lithohypha guttulata]|uniref:CAP-Gly domain-containing protein n=1 Tax=Lithohypha guttulata TaxID=1690604 RepID=A0AAN7T1H2_9EURO|nr:hypothetical protein LTR05_004282 [Lithohypha guttulata]
MTTPALKIGQHVKSTGKDPYHGILRYIGPIEGGPAGTYCGIELPEATGKNDGSAKGRRYFQCSPNHGVFVKKDVVVPTAATKPTAKRVSTIAPSPSVSRTAPATVASRRTSNVPASRPSSIRQSISNVAPVQKLTASRPSSQVILRESIPSRAGRSSVPGTPRVLSPEKQILNDIPQEESGTGEEDNTDGHESEGDQQHEEDNGSHVPEATPMAPPPRNEPAVPSASTRTSTGQSSMVALQASREIEQLKVKLRAMEKKRMEDRDTIKQVETLKSENDRMKTIIQGLSTKVKEVNQDKQAALLRAQELERAKEAEPEGSAELESMLEMATLDKETAEEKADALEEELKSLRAKLEESELEAEILREENKELASTMTEEEKAGSGWLHLERERDRLKAALLMLRDHKNEIEADYKEEIHHLQETLNETEEDAAKYVETAEQLQRVQDTNEHLREQLEAAENQEEVISTMMQERDRHLAQIEDLRVTLSELEELAQTNEDLEKFYLDTEKGLLSKIDEQEAEVNERTRQVNDRDQAIEDLEFTLSKFRTITQGLQSDIDDARRTREISAAQAQEMNSRSKAIMELNVRLQNSASKSTTKAIELELVKAQALSSKSHVDILSLFLPDSFDTLRNPILAMLTFSQLRTKAGIVANMLGEKLRDRASVMSGEEILLGHRIVESMQSIHMTADRFERFMSVCSSDEFAAFSNAGQEVEPVERAVTNWLESLKNDELGADGPDHLNRMESILSDLADKLLVSSPETEAMHLLAESRMVSSYVEVAASISDWLAKIIRLRLGDPNDEDPESIDLDRKFDRISRLARTIRTVANRLVGELEKMRLKHICLDETAWPLFADIEHEASGINNNLRQLSQVVLAYLNQVEDEDDLSYTALLNTFTHDDNDMLSTILDDLKTLHEQTEHLLNRTNDVAKALSFEPGPAPWVLRAKEIKAQRLISTDVHEELTQSHRKNQELSAILADRERTIEETAIRAELAEKRVRENKAREVHDKALKEESEKLKTELAELEAELSNSRSELIALQEQTQKDKEELAKLQAQPAENVAKGTSAPPSARSLDPATSNYLSIHNQTLLAEIATLQASIRHLKWENRELSIPVSEVKFTAANQAWLDPRHLKPSKTKTNAKLQTHAERSDTLDSLLAISKSMHMRPVKLKNTLRKEDKWRSVKETTRWQVLRQKEEFEAWDGAKEVGADGFVIRL